MSKPTAARDARIPAATPRIPKMFPRLAVIWDERPEIEPMLSATSRNAAFYLPMHRRLLTRYPASTRPPIPVVAAARNPPPNKTPGIAYSHGYSFGSVAPVSG